MQLTKAVNDYVLGTLVSDDLPSFAVQALADGYDSPTLFQLAGAEGSDTEHLRRLFSRAITELGITLPSPMEAGLSTAESIAENVLKGKVEPYEGAKLIWDKVYTRFPELLQLRPFVGLASEYEDDEKHRAEYRCDILEECSMLLRAEKRPST
jgi:hypothetical protein